MNLALTVRAALFAAAALAMTVAEAVARTGVLY
jgi:hypothetical protein